MSGYNLIASHVRTIPTTTVGVGNIGNVVDRMWRNAAKTQCIFAARVTLLYVDHDAGAVGTQLFLLNDIARGGFSGSGDVSAGYFSQSSVAFPVYRIGRTFTSVAGPGLPPIQDAVVNSNWVNFTTKAYVLGSSVSTMTYVQVACDASNPITWIKSGAISLRQAAQNANTFKSIEVDGFAPPGAVVP